MKLFFKFYDFVSLLRIGFAVPEQPATPIAETQWTIRTEKGQTFGPASLETMRQWASDGRVAPTSEASQNGTNWVPVTVLDLDMDWIAEVSPATFYGPIHRNAIDELIRDGSLSASAACFNRVKPDAPAANHLLAQMQVAETARHEAETRAETLERQLNEVQRARDQAFADLKARDHEFDAERQELKAAHNRAQADLIKKEGRLTNLETENTRLANALQAAKEAQARFAEAEHQVAQLRQSAEESQRQIDALRQTLKLAQHEHGALRVQAEQEHRELGRATELLQVRQAQLDQARRFAQQLDTALNINDDPVAEDAEIVAEPESIPPVSSPTGRKTTAPLSLVDIEKQAQRELRKMGETGNSLFKRPKKS